MTITLEDLRRVNRDGVKIPQLRCPGCRLWGDLDDDQVHGRVSIQCEQPGCTFHATVDLSLLLSEVSQ